MLSKNQQIKMLDLAIQMTKMKNPASYMVEGEVTNSFATLLEMIDEAIIIEEKVDIT